MHAMQNRRSFMAGLAAGTAGLVAAPRLALAEPPPETTSVRLLVWPKIVDCQSPIYMARELLQAEGLTDVRFVESGPDEDAADWFGHEIDFDWDYPPAHIRAIDQGMPVTVLAGMHVGCLELFVNDRVRTIPDLRGKRLGGEIEVLIEMIISYIGLDPHKDIEWVSTPDPVQSFADGAIDAFFAIPPQTEMMRERNLGHVLLRTASDLPWSHYSCCLLAGNADYVRRYPVATKRVLRALLKAVDLCATDPQRAARLAVNSGLVSRYDYAVHAVGSTIRYDTWREYDPEDTLRFFALRLQEAGLIKSTPNEIIANGTDWLFFKELRREMKT
jgi:NitT/TauT family transport system substrate-binding protein